jgi:hypothetical protein
MKQTKGSLHGPKPNVDFAPGKPLPRSTQRPAGRPHGSHSNESSWLSAGLFRILLFGAIAVGGVAVLMWLRDVGTASGVNWLH